MESTTSSLQQTVKSWTEDAIAKFEAGSLNRADLNQLLEMVQKSGTRQRLLYLHAVNPSIYSELIGESKHEPEEGAITEIDPMHPDMAYNSVHDAIIDGWRVIHFPQQRSAYEDREIDILGYEFILEKQEWYDA